MRTHIRRRYAVARLLYSHFRRTLDSGSNIQNTPIEDVMSTGYKSISSGALAAEAARLMQDSNVYVLIVKDDSATIAGIIKMHDLLQANVV